MADNNTNEKITKTFGLIYIYIFLIGLVIGLLYMVHITSIGFNEVKPPLPDTTKQKSDFSLVESKNVSSVDLDELLKPNKELIAKGKNIFQNSCTPCHGANGKGDGPAAVVLNPHPRNFTKKEGWINGPTISGIFTTLTNGISGSAMTSFSQLSPEDRFSLAQYIRNDFVPNPPQDTKEQLEKLNSKFHLAKGHVSSGQIPIEDAMQLIINENKPKYNELSKVAALISSQKGNEGSQIFEKITKDPIKALTILSDSKTWENDKNEFIKTVANNVNQGGFDSEIFTLSGNQWNTLFEYLKAYFD